MFDRTKKSCMVPFAKMKKRVKMFKEDIQEKLINNLKSIAKNRDYTIIREADNVSIRYIVEKSKKEIFRIRRSNAIASTDIPLSISLNKVLLWEVIDDNLLSDLYMTIRQEYNLRQSGNKLVTKSLDFDIKKQQSLLKYTEKYLQNTK